MTDTKSLLNDERLEKILNMIQKYSKGEFSFQEKITEQKDDLDVIIAGLNALAKNRYAFVQKTTDYQKRVENLMNILLKYTLLDFSEKAEISEYGDEIDAIAMALNSLSEELLSTINLNQSNLETLKDSNAQITTLLENAPNAVIVIDEQGAVMKWNKQSEVIFGWAAEEVMHHPMHELIIPERYVQAHQQGMEHFLKSGKKKMIGKTIEISAVRKNKEEFPIELSISATKTQDQFLFIAFISDISHRKKVEQEVKRINQNLADSVKALESFTYSVSHDLRAPLRAIHGYVNMLKNNYSSVLDERGQTMMDAVMRNSKKMGQLIDGLLSLSRLEGIVLEKKQVDMNELVQAVITELSLDDTKVQIILYPLPPTVLDFNLFTQVYMNLISNAVKYSSLKEKSIVEIGTIKENNEIVYYVKDNGSGFDMQFYNKLFGVFQRLHDSSEFEGNGIGLSIVKQIITRHKGRIWANAEPDKGATFYFTINTLKETP